MWSRLLPPPVLKALRSEPSLEGGLWLVGGAIRDSFLDRETGDFDFAVAGDGLSLARRIADSLDGNYFALDEARGTGRVVASGSGHRWRTLDFAELRGADIEADLRARDFTVNAMALEAFGEELIDPTGGLRDLKDGRLILCSPEALAHDPLRGLRALRLSSELGFRLNPELVSGIREVRAGLADVSIERRREELFRILALPRPAAPLRAAQQVNLLDSLLPGLAPDRIVSGLETLNRLSHMLTVLIEQHDPDQAGDLTIAQLSLRLGRFRGAMADRLGQAIAGDRSRLQLVKLAALAVAEGARGAADGTRQLVACCQQLRLSRAEVGHMTRIEGGLFQRESRPLQDDPSRRELYRYYRDLGEAGLEVVLLSLARFLALAAGPPDQGAWNQMIEVARGYLEPWLEGPAEWLDPPALVQGEDLMAEFDLEPGPTVGRLLESIREAQAAGEVEDRAGALALAEDRLDWGRSMGEADLDQG